MVNIWVANTDPDWFDFLAQSHPDEVNFWQPSGSSNFGAIGPGELFLFRLKSPRNAIGGFGVFSHASNIPLSLAWEAFGRNNGAPTMQVMKERVSRYRNEPVGPASVIGCRIVVQPVFLPEFQWIRQPEDWAGSIVVGKRYDTAGHDGARLWDAVVERAQTLAAPLLTEVSEDEGRAPIWAGPRYGAPALVRPRLGQGAFRVAVTDAYRRECAISPGRVLPALEAAHIRSYAEGGTHDIANGLLLRRDIHSVFDAGYVTFDEEERLVVSERVRTEFNNGEEYRRLHGIRLKSPVRPEHRPDPAVFAWHRENVFEQSFR